MEKNPEIKDTNMEGMDMDKEREKFQENITEFAEHIEEIQQAASKDKNQSYLKEKVADLKNFFRKDNYFIYLASAVGFASALNKLGSAEAIGDSEKFSQFLQNVVQNPEEILFSTAASTMFGIGIKYAIHWAKKEKPYGKKTNPEKLQKGKESNKNI